MFHSNETDPAAEKVGLIPRFLQWLQAPLSKTLRVMLALGGIVAPIVCHLSTLDRPPHGGRWQSGGLNDQLAFILTFEAGYVLYPFMLYAIASLGIYLLRWPTNEHKRTFWIRLGTINGVLLSMWYMCIFVIVATGQQYFDLTSTLVSMVTLLLLIAVPVAAWSVVTFVKFLCRKFRQPAVVGGMLLLLVYLVGGTWIGTVRNGVGFLDAFKGTLAVPFFLGLIFAPVWSFSAYAFVSFRLLTIEKATAQFSLLQLMSLVTYTAGLITACRTSVWLSLSAYSQLPLERPSTCYVATAASKGHPLIVRTWSSKDLDRGSAIVVNRQLQVLKAFEIALRTLLPTGHRRLRRVYNFIGPRLARRIDRPWKADIAFVSLKPVEWLAAGTLQIVLGSRFSIVRTLYCGSRFR